MKGNAVTGSLDRLYMVLATLAGASVMTAYVALGHEAQR